MAKSTQTGQQTGQPPSAAQIKQWQQAYRGVAAAAIGEVLPAIQAGDKRQVGERAA